MLQYFFFDVTKIYNDNESIPFPYQENYRRNYNVADNQRPSVS